MAPSPTLRRLLKETKELSESSSNPNPAFYAAPVSDSDLHEWHFTLLGPPAPSPYAGGLYHGRINLPPAYPMKPPNFRFLTASGRFEVNREICLSISGFHEETWQPAWGIRTALTALRSFMAEPGTAGQVGGMESSEEVRKTLAKASRHWKCSACGQSNEERMKEWWNVCAARGIKVDEEGEHMAIEALPEGLKVEAREAKPQDGGEHTPSPVVSSQAGEASDVVVPVMPQTNSSGEPHSTERPTSIPNTSIQHSTPETSRSTQIQTDSNVPGTQIGGSALATRHGSVAMRHIDTVPRPNEEQPTITIDRAITVVVLALFIMILKKIFYPASAGGFSYDELNLLRE